MRQKSKVRRVLQDDEQMKFFVWYVGFFKQFFNHGTISNQLNLIGVIGTKPAIDYESTRLFDIAKQPGNSPYHIIYRLLFRIL